MQAFVLLLVAVFSIIMIYRIFYAAGMPLGNRSPVTSYITSKKDTERSGHLCSFKEISSVGAQALFFRLAVYFVSYLTLILIYKVDQSFTDWWLKWDATNYIGIAEGGYKNIVIDGVYAMGDNVYQTLVFFPLYPAFTWIVNLVADNIYIAAFATSTLCYVGGCIFLYMAVAYRYSVSIAEKAVVLISVFPFSFYFGGMLPESTFLLVASACIYFTFRKKWWIAGLFAGLCSLSRMQGILIIVFMGLEWLIEYRIFDLIKNKSWKAFGKKLVYLIPIMAPLAGFGIYLLINYINTGDFLYFLKLQANVWSHSFKDVGTGLSKLFKYLAEEETFALIFSAWGSQIILFFLTLYVIFRHFRSHADSLTSFLFVYTLISYSTDYLVSGGRYLSIALPLFIMTACVCEKRPALYKFIVAVSLMLMVILMCCHTSGQNLVT